MRGFSPVKSWQVGRGITAYVLKLHYTSVCCGFVAQQAVQQMESLSATDPQPIKVMDVRNTRRRQTYWPADMRDYAVIAYDVA